MKLRDKIAGAEEIRLIKDGFSVEKTIAAEIQGLLSERISASSVSPAAFQSTPHCINIAVDSGGMFGHFWQERGLIRPDRDWLLISADNNECIWFLSSKPSLLYTGFRFGLENLWDEEVGSGRTWLKEISFPKEKSTFDLFLTQYARMIRHFNREEYIRQYARLGFTHIEVNGLATMLPAEQGVDGEFYPDFYTYCPALDQFVSSRLNQGLYPEEYLKSNLNLLKENSRLAVKYGLVPGLLCFEPRSVPETIFQKYPTIRGARVDHPFRSFKPRYNLSIVHPTVQLHYAELMTNMMKEVPDLGFITIWTNDSGAGFEHTKSLYVGRNGGAYLIREWKDDREIARAASQNISNFFRVLRDSAQLVNPQFRVITRLESFYGEREFLWPELDEGVEVEGNSLLTTGWETNYSHPEYPDIKVLGSGLHNSIDEKERTPLEELRSRGSEAFFYHFLASHGNHEPLLGIPFPWLAYDKLKSAFQNSVRSLSHMGGIQPPGSVPYAVNQEVFRHFQIDPEIDIDMTILSIAKGFIGPDNADMLVGIWRQIDLAVRKSVPLSIYTHYGVVWQRLFVRPLVPDIDRIPEDERAYYERFMCTSVHNPNRVDLSQDVLFKLIDRSYAHTAFKRIEDNVIPHLTSALLELDGALGVFKGKPESREYHVFRDQNIRCRALRCLCETLRNTAAWIYSVHEYLETSEENIRTRCRMILDELIEREISNTQELISLCEETGVDWMILSERVETPFIYGENIAANLEKKIRLMRRHKNDDPRIDSNYMFRIPNDPYSG
ncbi:hypothetical protein ACFLT9_09800 [Acidobacteriota bacterium]